MNTIITSSLTHSLTQPSTMCECECETSTYKQSGMDRVEKLMNALVGWMVLTACKRIRIWMLMKSFAQERKREEEQQIWIAEERHNTHTERKLFASIHHFKWTPPLSIRMPMAICLHCTPTICLPFHWHCGFSKLKSCAKSANNACDISLKIPHPKKANAMANLCHENSHDMISERDTEF